MDRKSPYQQKRRELLLQRISRREARLASVIGLRRGRRRVCKTASSGRLVPRTRKSIRVGIKHSKIRIRKRRRCCGNRRLLRIAPSKWNSAPVIFHWSPRSIVGLSFAAAAFRGMLVRKRILLSFAWERFPDLCQWSPAGCAGR